MCLSGLMRKQGASSALRAMGRRGAAIGRPLGYGTPQSGYWTPFGLWDGAERLLDALRAMGRLQASYWIWAIRR